MNLTDVQLARLPKHVQTYINGLEAANERLRASLAEAGWTETCEGASIRRFDHDPRRSPGSELCFPIRAGDRLQLGELVVHHHDDGIEVYAYGDQGRHQLVIRPKSSNMAHLSTGQP